LNRAKSTFIRMRGAMLTAYVNPIGLSQHSLYHNVHHQVTRKSIPSVVHKAQPSGARNSRMAVLQDDAIVGRRASIATLFLITGVLPSFAADEQDAQKTGTFPPKGKLVPTPAAEAVSGLLSGTAVSVAKQVYPIYSKHCPRWKQQITTSAVSFTRSLALFL
jgi:hypothetical protein